MIIYKCIVSGDEMFSDIFKVSVSSCGFFYEVTGKIISRTEGQIDDSLLGANASAEEALESSESTTFSGVDIVLNHKLQETPFVKKDYAEYIKGYVKYLKAKLQESNPDQVEDFMAKAPEAVKKILKNFKNYQFFTGESMNPDGAVALLDYREDGVTPFMLFIKEGLEIEKC